MATLMVPPVDLEPYPTLGKQVCDFIEDLLVFGPGDLLGQPARLDPEKRALVYRAYEVYPQGHPQAGRRRFQRVSLSLMKGSAKTEFAAWIAAAELHPDGPVRCDGFDSHGQPVGRGVVDPYIPLCAYTEEQTEELAYGALLAILEKSPIVNDFDLGLQRIMRKDGHGKAVAVASSPNSTDGARTTFEHFDESHRFTLPNLKKAHKTMLANLAKRKGSDPWALETTTAFTPGEDSIAEGSMGYAEAIRDGKVEDPKLFFFHRQASDVHDIKTDAGLRAAIKEASGPNYEWTNVEAIIAQFRAPDADLPYLERVWLNRIVQSSGQAFDADLWKQLAQPHEVPAGEWITLGFDGSRLYDATGIIATHIATGYQWVIGAWERPYGPSSHGWEVPEAEVETAMALAFGRWKVWRLYADPPYWETEVAKWSGQYGAERVVAWRTNRDRPMAYALQAWQGAQTQRELSHDGDEMFTRHVGNARRRLVNVWDDQDTKNEPTKRLWVITKERSDSPHKIDLAVAAALSWEARRDALASGINLVHESIYNTQPLMVI